MADRLKDKEPEKFVLTVDNTESAFKTFNSALEFIAKNELVSFTVKDDFGEDLTVLARELIRRIGKELCGAT